MSVEGVHQGDKIVKVAVRFYQVVQVEVVVKIYLVVVAVGVVVHKWHPAVLGVP